MISLQNDPSAILLKSYLPPFRGTWKTLPPHLLPDDVLQDSFNTALVGGVLRSRAGLQLFTESAVDTRVRGSFLFTGVSNQKTPVIGTRKAIYRLAGTAWVNMSTALVIDAGIVEAQQNRFTAIQSGAYVYLLMTNGVNPLMFSQELAGFQIVPSVDGTQIPIPKDLCTVAGRIVAVTPPYTIAWCNVLNNAFLNFQSWPALNQVILADTEDSIVAVRPLGTLGFAVYKEANIFVGIAQTGPQSAAFRFEHRGEFQGPGGINAIVNWNGTHVYMTPSGRIGVFDGSQHQWIADGIWPFLRGDIDPTRAGEIFGVYNYLTSEIYFWYPRLANANANDGMVQIAVPYPSAGINDFACFLGRSSFDCSHALSIRYFQGRLQPFVFRGITYQTYTLDTNAYRDDTASFSCTMTTGVFRPPAPQQGTRGGDVYRPVYELFATRDSLRGTVDLAAITTNQLEATNGPAATVSQVERLDLTMLRPQEYVSFPDGAGKFLGVQLAWQSTSRLEYKGCDVYARRTT